MSMEQINPLYQSLKDAKEALELAEADAKQKKDNFDRLSKDLGDILYALGMTEVKMSDGREVGIKTTYYGNVSQDRIEGIRMFLNLKGNAGILKPRKLTLKDEDVAELPDTLQAKVAFEINTNTLKAFLQELAKKGELSQDVQELFSVYTENKVILA